MSDMTHDIMAQWLKDQAITEVECLVSDIAGIPRGKILPVHKFSQAAAGQGLRLKAFESGDYPGIAPGSRFFWRPRSHAHAHFGTSAYRVRQR